MHYFTAIDFETAQHARNSICQVGLVRVENGKITKEISLLVQPPDNYYFESFTEVHGIKPEDTADAPTFDKIWPQIEVYIKNQIVVAHNGFSFDFDVLKQTLNHYGLQMPVYEKQCTYKIFRDKLSSLCEKYKIPLNHHDALSDAKACAELYLLHLKRRV